MANEAEPKPSKPLLKDPQPQREPPSGATLRLGAAVVETQAVQLVGRVETAVWAAWVGLAGTPPRPRTTRRTLNPMPNNPPRRSPSPNSLPLRANPNRRLSIPPSRLSSRLLLLEVPTASTIPLPPMHLVQVVVLVQLASRPIRECGRHLGRRGGWMSWKWAIGSCLLMRRRLVIVR